MNCEDLVSWTVGLGLGRGNEADELRPGLPSAPRRRHRCCRSWLDLRSKEEPGVRLKEN